MSETKKYPRIEDGRLYLSCVCDGTLFFLDELKRYLQAFGCTDIQGHMEIVKDADPPWMNCRFVAHGKVPDERPEEAYKDGRLRKYLRDQVYRFCTHCGPTREQVEKVWKGEWINKHSAYDHKIFTCAQCGKQISIQGENLDFCPKCGSAQTDKAVDIIMQRLEELKDEVD